MSGFELGTFLIDDVFPTLTMMWTYAVANYVAAPSEKSMYCTVGVVDFLNFQFLTTEFPLERILRPKKKSRLSLFLCFLAQK
jgi:hypothetical protein